MVINDKNNSEVMNEDEKFDFLYKEYEYNQKRKEGIGECNDKLLCWNIALFGFIITFIDIKKMIKVLTENFVSCSYKCSLRMIYIILLFILLSGIILCVISLIEFFSLHGTEDINCFELNKIKEKCFDKGYVNNELINILDDYDRKCEEHAKVLNSGRKFFIIGCIFIFVSFALIKILNAILI